MLYLAIVRCYTTVFLAIGIYIKVVQALTNRLFNGFLRLFNWYIHLSRLFNACFRLFCWCSCCDRNLCRRILEHCHLQEETQVWTIIKYLILIEKWLWKGNCSDFLKTKFCYSLLFFSVCSFVRNFDLKAFYSSPSWFLSKSHFLTLKISIVTFKVHHDLLFLRA